MMLTQGDFETYPIKMIIRVESCHSVFVSCYITNNENWQKHIFRQYIVANSVF
jgi:hypothetical protein